MTNISKIINNNMNGGTFISINTSTAVKLTGGKKNPLQGLVRKVTEGTNVMIFQNKIINGYNGMVMRRLKQEGKDPDSFKLSPRVWGVRLPDTPFVEHKGKHYLEVITLKPGKSHYEVDGQVTSAHLITGLPKKPQAPKQGSLENKVIVRSYNVDSITQLVINKQEYNDIQY